MKITKEEVLSYHKEDKPGKKEIAITKSFETQKDLSIAYTPGVAYVCEEIAKNPEAAYDYTTKGNFVAVVTNGTAVLGLGDIGPLAAKPVMEGKAILFKKFAGINAVGILVDEKDPEKFIEIVRAISPTFGGINLEDIKAPECFYIEEKLKKITDIPVMHDDQHGTAIVTTAAMINACKLTNRDIASLKVVIVGSGAAAIASARMYRHLGVKEIILIDSKGVVHAGRTDRNPYKKEFALPHSMRREEAFNDADMVLGLSIPGAVQEEDIARMKDEPFVFVCSNPTPEIMPDVVRSIKPQAIIATGRSDFPNQVNNVLGFPFLFRGALDTRSSAINYEMMLAAANALAALARKDVPEEVKKIYNKDLFFSKEYIIPTPFDKRLLVEVSAAVAKAAMESGVARKVINIEEYKQRVATFI
ncbi:malic enzyme-like NAD(P)-binding protein [Nitratiruptor tergarcus]|uniref:Malate dehydrogenase (Oxaloacetate-decarboxylating)(NADP+) n=1 Tax=Nitratiruptor tergarcus DSM 16512 TaxID=1069081 RepID=A0A1W1WQB0_9BACT|nr:malic enzyme-like NAD(P)-binding protein [Nitratiruptor tergarcus]SMC08491.1 malate dehydrogenase (oxaloacetate-decarboxylating)(NADP+) [Nitratiruptor tergarcus DSM 16512]